jgi:glyoxylase I family protein
MSKQQFKGVDVVFLPVSNLDQSLAWYDSVMGFEMTFKDVEHKAAGMETGGAIGVILVEVKQHKPIVFPENDYMVDISFNYRAADINQLYQDLTDKGIALTPMSVSSDTTFRCFGFADLDGNRISVVS